MRRALVIVCLGLLLAAVLGPIGLWRARMAEGRTVPGLRVAGQRLAPTADPEAELEVRAEAWLSERVGLRAGPEVVLATRRELGARLALAELSGQLLGIGRSGTLLADLEAWNDARSGRVDLPWPVTVDEAAAARVVAGLAPLVDRDPVVARFSAQGRLSAMPEPGLALDVAAGTAALVTALRHEEALVVLPVTETPPEVVPPPATQDAFAEVVASYTTRFGGPRGRRNNVRLAAERLDGAVLAPGAALSFNGRVGERDLGAGFQIAPEILRGELVDGVGGGTCQVASTLHAAAFVGGLDVVEHSPHSRPAGYVPMGLDATVVWPSVDLVVRNPYPFPVLVRTRTEGNRLTVDLLGSGPGARVEWSRRVLEREDAETRIVEDPDVPPGEERVTEEGVPGYVVQRTRTLDRGAGPVTEERVLRYPPAHRIVRVAPGMAPALPAAPTAGAP